MFSVRKMSTVSLRLLPSFMKMESISHGRTQVPLSTLIINFPIDDLVDFIEKIENNDDTLEVDYNLLSADSML